MWKQKQYEDKTGKRIKLALLSLAILIGLVLFSKSLEMLSSFSKPYNLDIVNNNPHLWDGDATINLVFANFKIPDDPKIYVFSLHPKDEKVVILQIPNQSYLELPKGMGSWPASSIYKLGQEEEKQPIGPYLLKLSLSKMLGLPIDGIIIKDQESQVTLQDEITNIRKNKLALISTLRQIKTDLTLFDTIRLLNKLSGVRPDKIITLDLARSTITESKLLPDQTRVLGVDTIALDNYVREKMSDQGFVDEGLSVAIFNATEHPGLAQEAARMVTNMGGNVVITSSTEIKQEKSSVVIIEREGREQVSEDSLTGNRLIGVFAPMCREKECKSADPKVANSRAQVNVILGEDFYKMWHTR